MGGGGAEVAFHLQKRWGNWIHPPLSLVVVVVVGAGGKGGREGGRKGEESYSRRTER